MKNIVIISHGETEQEGLAEILRPATVGYELRFARDGRQATGMAEETATALIIYELSSFAGDQVDNLGRLTSRFPYIPCLAILDEEGTGAESVLRTGVSRCLIRPLPGTALRRHLSELLQLSSSGHMLGIPITSMLQLMENENKTCTLKIRSLGRDGLIFVRKGEVVGAETEGLEGEAAFFALLAWEAPFIEVRYYNGTRPRTIHKPLISLILEGMCDGEEEESLQTRGEMPDRAHRELKHLSTIGSRLPLEIGARISLELDGDSTPVISTMVGMVPEELLIVTAPSPLSLVEPALASGSRIIVKYLHLSRLCMFKSRMLKLEVDPQHLLFLEYPPAIHYHELRRIKRTSIFIPCTLHLAKGPEYFGVLIDLSDLGCLCQVRTRTNKPLPPLAIGTKVQLRCLLPGVKEDQELAALVKNVRAVESETRIGLEFVGLQSYLRDVIDHYVYPVQDLDG